MHSLCSERPGRAPRHGQETGEVREFSHKCREMHRVLTGVKTHAGVGCSCVRESGIVQTHALGWGTRSPDSGDADPHTQAETPRCEGMRKAPLVRRARILRQRPEPQVRSPQPALPPRPPLPVPPRPPGAPRLGGGRRAARAGGGKGSGPGAPRPPPPRVAAAGARREQSSGAGRSHRSASHGPAGSPGDEESLHAAPLALARHCLGGR